MPLNLIRFSELLLYQISDFGDKLPYWLKQWLHFISSSDIDTVIVTFLSHCLEFNIQFGSIRRKYPCSQRHPINPLLQFSLPVPEMTGLFRTPDLPLSGVLHHSVSCQYYSVFFNILVKWSE